jgi:hypothetical protein
MYKKLIAFLSVLSLSVSLPSIPVNAAVKAGYSCKPEGTTSVVGSKTFTCIKSGKKLVWNKGVSKSTTSAPVEIPISIENLDLKGVPQQANVNVLKILNSRPRSEITPTKYIGPNVKQARVDQELNGLNKAIDLWAPYFQPHKFQVVYVVKGDEEWIEKISSDLGLSSMVPPGVTFTEYIRRWSQCGFAFAGYAKQIPTFVQCLGAYYAGGYMQTGPHEYTHLFQRDYGGFNMYKIPWYAEGSASFFGWTLGFHPNELDSYRSWWLSVLFSGMSSDAKADFMSKDLQRFKKRMTSLVPQSGQDNASISYWAGGLATEVLIALYGFDKFVDFTKNMKSNPDLSSLLMQTYGFDDDYFYEKLAPFIWAQIPVLGQ